MNFDMARPGLHFASFVAALVGGSPAYALDTPSHPAASVTRDGSSWTVVLRLDRDAPVWGLTASSQMQAGQPQWRPIQWKVETPGVILDRVGSRDVLRTTNGEPVPLEVRLSLTPASGAVAAAYDPALLFSDGSVAMFSGQFDVFPLSSIDAARELPADLNGLDLQAEATRVTWRDSRGPVLFQGRRVDEATASDAQTYVLFGEAGLEEHPTLATVVDPEIPLWVQELMTAYAPRITAYYAERLGGEPPIRPTIMASWKGPTPGKTSMGGSVLPGLIVASFEGQGLTQRTDRLVDMVRWFIGHESAHFWLGQIVRYEVTRDMWITEGGADLMAIRAAQALDPNYDHRSALQAKVDDCLTLADGRGVAAADTRGEHRAYYACGAVFALAAEGAEHRRSNGDWLDVLRPLIEANRQDGVLSRAEWLSHFETSAGVEARGIVEDFLDEGVADPRARMARLLDLSGVSYRMDGERLLLD